MRARLRPLPTNWVGRLAGGLRATSARASDPVDGTPAPTRSTGPRLPTPIRIRCRAPYKVAPSTPPPMASCTPPPDPAALEVSAAAALANELTDCWTLIWPKCSSSRLARAGTHDGTIGSIGGRHTGTGDCVWVSVNLICRPGARHDLLAAALHAAERRGRDDLHLVAGGLVHLVEQRLELVGRKLITLHGHALPADAEAREAAVEVALGGARRVRHDRARRTHPVDVDLAVEQGDVVHGRVAR